MKMRLGLIGYGEMGRYHFTRLQDYDRIKIVKIYDIDEERRALAVRDGLIAAPSAEDLLNDPAIDTVLIVTPNDKHEEYAVRAARAGKNILLEKPAAMSPKSFSRILAEKDAAGVKLMVNHSRRWDSDFLTVSALAHSGEIGKIYYVESCVMASNGIPGTWRKQKARGGGMIYDWGVHLVDQILFAHTAALTDIDTDCSYICGEEVDDGFRAHLRFADGFIAEIVVDTNSYITRPRWTVYGTEGTARIGTWGEDMEIVCLKKREDNKICGVKAGMGMTKTMARRGEGTVSTSVRKLTVPDEYVFYDHFVDFVEKDMPPIIRNEQVMRTLCVLERMFQSAETGQRIRFENKK